MSYLYKFKIKKGNNKKPRIRGVLNYCVVVSYYEFRSAIIFSATLFGTLS